EAGHALVAATSGAEVMAVVRTAVARLLPPNTHHRVVLQVAEPDAAPVGSRSDPPVTFPLSAAQDTAASASAAISIATATAAAARSRAGRFGEDGASLVPTSSLGASFAADAADFDTTLVRPLTVTDRPSGETTVGVLYLSARHESLAALRGAVEVLGSQAALALDRINLSNEITRRNSEEYFRTLVHNTSDVILILNEDDRIRYASPSANPLFGLADLTGVSLIAVIEPDDRELVSQGLTAARSGRDVDVTADWTVLNADGQRVQVEVTCRDLRTDPTVRGLVVTLRNVTERRRLERELTHRAFHDSLTGLANRVLFGERVAQAMARSAWDGRIIGVLFIDLDDFKVVNDTMGHEMGDELLVSVARKLSATLRTNDVAARLGGDEFAALIEDARDTDDVELVAERMIAMFAEPFLINGTQLHASASIGVATTADASDGRDLLRQADLALYVAKGAGKGRWRRYQSALHTAIVERLQLRAELDQAIPDGALALRFQPIVDLRTGHTNAFEALVRWYHPTRGLILPNQFIDVAEESGLIVPIGNWVLEKALDAAADWHRELADQPGPADAPYVSVNVSARQFRMPDFANRVRRELDRVGLPPSALMLEITESLLLRDDDQVWSDLTTLRQSGIRIAIDDFGTGYSSLSYLRQVPVDVVKIDRSFIDTMSSSAQQRALVEGIVRLAHTLGLKVIAEGIERISDRELLAAMGCPMGQGYLFSQPLTDNEATKWMSNDRPEV
ncbi:MAG TPA: EAL domain-containing protein, partial [Micromonosporaceae bacterium]